MRSPYNREREDRMDKIDPKAVHFIRTAISRFVMKEYESAALLMERYGVPSIEALSREQGEDLVAYFQSLGFGRKKRKWTCKFCIPRIEKSQSGQKDAPCPVNLGQFLVINEFQKAVKWEATGGFSLWLLRYFGITEVKTGLEAIAVMAALKGLLRNQKGKCGSCPHRSSLKTAGTAGGEAPCRE